jgi:hypothetical protein
MLLRRKTAQLLPERLFAYYQFAKNSNRLRNKRKSGSHTVNNADMRKAGGFCAQCPGGSGLDHFLQRRILDLSRCRC